MLVLLAGGGVAIAFVMQQQQQKVVIEQEDVTPMPTRDEDEAVVKTRMVDLSTCVRKHAIDAPIVLLGLLIDAGGKTEKISFEPDEVDKSPLGPCLRKVLIELQFKKRKHSIGRPIELKLRDVPK
jgi:hypothetical protein